MGATRTVEFTLESPIDSIISVSIHWVGTITSGRGRGDGVEGSEDEWFAWPAEFSAMMDPPGAGFWYAFTGAFNGAFDETTCFEDFLSPTWRFLKDGKGEISVRLAPAMIIGGNMGSYLLTAR